MLIMMIVLDDVYDVLGLSGNSYPSLLIHRRSGQSRLRRSRVVPQSSGRLTLEDCNSQLCVGDWNFYWGLAGEGLPPCSLFLWPMCHRLGHPNKITGMQPLWETMTSKNMTSFLFPRHHITSCWCICGKNVARWWLGWDESDGCGCDAARWWLGWESVGDIKIF